MLVFFHGQISPSIYLQISVQGSHAFAMFFRPRVHINATPFTRFTQNWTISCLLLCNLGVPCGFLDHFFLLRVLAPCYTTNCILSRKKFNYIQCLIPVERVVCIIQKHAQNWSMGYLFALYASTMHPAQLCGGF